MPKHNSITAYLRRSCLDCQSTLILNVRLNSRESHHYRRFSHLYQRKWSPFNKIQANSFSSKKVFLGLKIDNLCEFILFQTPYYWVLPFPTRGSATSLFEITSASRRCFPTFCCACRRNRVAYLSPSGQSLSSPGARE